MRESGKVYIYIQSYDCVEYIEKIIKDVLQQTYSNWMCFVYDNASKDGTWDIVKAYAEKDDRFVVARFEKQVGLMVKQAIPAILKLADIEKDYFVRVDADDRIDTDYLERMIEFREMHAVDLVCCNNDFVMAQSGKVTGSRDMEEDMILEGDMFSDVLLQYHPFMRTHWAKLYPIALLRKMRLCSILDTAYGIDTLFSEEAFREAGRVGIMKRCMYHYYLHEGQKTYDLRMKRYEAPNVLADKLMDFLILKTRKITKENTDIVYRIFDGEMEEAVKALQETKFLKDERLEILYNMAKSHHTGNFLKRGVVAKWIYDIVLMSVDMYDAAGEAEREKLAEIMSIMQVCPAAICGISKSVLFDLYVKMDKYWADANEPNRVEDAVGVLLKDNPFVTFTDMRLALLYSELVMAVLDEDYANAYGIVNDLLVNNGVFIEHISELATLGKNLAAVIEDESLFIEMTKYSIQGLLINGKYHEANVELDDWDSLFPEDNDFREFRRIINTSDSTTRE